MNGEASVQQLIKSLQQLDVFIYECMCLPSKKRNFCCINSSQIHRETLLVRAGRATQCLAVRRGCGGVHDVLQHTPIYLLLDSTQTNKKVFPWR